MKNEGEMGDERWIRPRSVVINTLIKTGFGVLDRKLGGLKPSDLVVVASSSDAVMKAFALNLVQHTAVKSDLVCAVFSLELTHEQIVRNLLCSMAGVNVIKFRTGNLSKADWSRLERAAARLTKAPLFTDDSPALSPREIAQKLRRLQKKQDLRLVVIDHLDLMRGNSRAKDRGTELAVIVKDLKVVAEKTGVPVIVLVDQGGKRAGRANGRLQEIELVVDTLLVIDGERVGKASAKGFKARIAIEKHWKGCTGKVKLSFPTIS